MWNQTMPGVYNGAPKGSTPPPPVCPVCERQIDGRYVVVCDINPYTQHNRPPESIKVCPACYTGLMHK